jgi:hypothetical protein
MRILLLHIIYLSCFIVFGQSTKDDYEIYSKTIDFGVKSFDYLLKEDNTMKPFQTVVFIEELDFQFKKDHLLFEKSKNKEFKDINKFMKWMFRDSTTKKSNEIYEIILDVLPSLDSTFNNHPRIYSDSLNLKNVKAFSISNDSFSELLDNSTNNYNKRWRKINRKFKHSLAFGLSKIKYNGNFASLYYWVDCGKFGLCRSEHVIVLEKVNGEWKVLNDFYLWISP